FSHSSYLLFISMLHQHPYAPLFPYTTLFRSSITASIAARTVLPVYSTSSTNTTVLLTRSTSTDAEISSASSEFSFKSSRYNVMRSEEHTSELQSRFDLVCRLLLEKKKIT